MDTDYDDEAVLKKFPTLYPDEFSLSRFVEVIESEEVWDESAQSS